MSSQKPQAHSVARRYRPVLVTTGPRDVVLRSLLIAGDIFELISVEDQRTHDDAYIQGIRNEIQGKPPYHGNGAKMMGLIHIATRRISKEDNGVLYRHTNPKRDKNGNPELDTNHREIFFPRMYIVRSIPEAERTLQGEERIKQRKTTLNTCAKILHEHDLQNKNRRQGGSPGRTYPPTRYHVPQPGWDLTPDPPKPLDWYITDQMITTMIHSIYTEQEFGRWDMFSEKVAEANCFFSPPYSRFAYPFGFRNPEESSVRIEPPPRQIEDEPEADVPQPFDANDVLPLEENQAQEEN